MDESLLDRLAGICPLDRSAEGRAGAGRDWWPLAVHWAAAGLVPALPAAVAAPATAAEVAGVLAACNEARVPVTAAGGRSGVCGASVPVNGGISLDLTGLAGIVDVAAGDLLVDVLPGTWGDDLEQQLRTEHGLTLGHWPQSMAISTVGGWLACRGAGQYSTRYGKVEDLVAGLEVVLADGRVVRTGTGGPRAALGPDLTQLFVGSEGTLGAITSARLRVRPRPGAEWRGTWVFDTFEAGLDACRRILRRGATPAVLRLYDPGETQRHLGELGGCALVVLDEGDPELVEAVARVVSVECGGPGGGPGARPAGEEPVARWLEHRNEVPSLADLAAAGIVADTVEVAAAWSVLPSLHADAVAAVEALDGTLLVSTHQSHAYPDGACLYFTFAGQPGDGLEAAERYYRAAWDAVMAATARHGGALSHHHGVGLNRARYVQDSPGGRLDVLAAVKAALDPRGILNPGKLGLTSPFGPPLR